MQSAYVFLNIIVYIMITEIVTDFQFGTVVGNDSQVYIVGLSKQRSELFRFRMDNS